MLFGGIDEAGYGPLLGPLSIAAAYVDAENEQTLKKSFRRARTGVKDSKQIHVSGDISAIESVALPAITWLSGSQPATAAELFSLMGESSVERVNLPWMADAESLKLPIAAKRLKTWKISEVKPRFAAGRLVQPQAFNDGARGGINRAEMELTAVGALLCSGYLGDEHAMTMVDRLGGRRYYREFLQNLWPETMVLIETESSGISSYRAVGNCSEHQIHFQVEGESASPMTAVASCMAKYAREVHMYLFNQYWGKSKPGLKATAGYTRDARRWLSDVGDIVVDPLRDILVRKSMLLFAEGSEIADIEGD